MSDPTATATALAPAPTPFTRDFAVTVDRAALAQRAEGDDRIPIAISSEQPVLRWDWGTGERYLEVLDHAPASIDLGRAARGLPLLLDHNTREQVGRVEDLTVDGDRRLRGYARFSTSQRGQEIRADFVDGIRTDISVGYDPGVQYDQTKDAAGMITRRYTRWTPLEVSSVPIPADPTVGVGRAAPANPAAAPTPSAAVVTAKETRMEQNSAAAAPPAAPAITREDVIRAQCEAANLSVREMNELIESRMSVREVALEIEAKRNAAQGGVTPAPASPEPADYRENGQRFDLGRAVRAAVAGNWKEAGYERAVSAAEAKRLGRDLNERTILMPTMERLSDEQIAKRAALVTSSATLGGNAVYTEYGGFIDLLRNRSALMRAGATMLPGLQGKVAFVKQTAAGTTYWLAENPGTDVTESNMTFGQVTLSPKTLMARQTVTNQLLTQAAINVDGAIRSDLARIVSLEMDRAGLHGSGASNQPTGVFNTSGINAQAFGGATLTYANVVAMPQKIATGNADIGPIVFIVTPETAAKGLQVQRFTSTDSPLYKGTFEEGELIGYRTIVSNQLPKNLGAGTNEHSILAGVWDQVLIGEWGAVQLTVDPYTLAGQDAVRLIVRAFLDINVRYPEAFTKGTGLIP